MSHRLAVRVALGTVVLLLVAACAAGPNPSVEDSGAGFWLGLWHGIIIPVTFVISLFNDNVSIYEVDNNGNWYDFGFMLGIAGPFSGIAGGSSRAARR
jgi:hypothetical protein